MGGTERGLAAFLLGVDRAVSALFEEEALDGLAQRQAARGRSLLGLLRGLVDEYRRIFAPVLLPEFGADTPLADITASRISEHRGRRLAATSVRRRDADGQARALSAASINRPLALLRHLLRTARDEWEVLETNDSAVKVLGDETLRAVARELVATVRKNVTIDWTLRENIRAQLRVLVKRFFRKRGYPPDKQEKATQTVLEQAELLSQEWAAA